MCVELRACAPIRVCVLVCYLCVCMCGVRSIVSQLIVRVRAQPAVAQSPAGFQTDTEIRRELRCCVCEVMRAYVCACVCLRLRVPPVLYRNVLHLRRQVH